MTRELAQCHQSPKRLRRLQRQRKPTPQWPQGFLLIQVDLKDQRRLKCPIVLSSRKRWWIRIFTKDLDECVQNAMILHKLATGKRSLNLLDFKVALIRQKLGPRIEAVPLPITQGRMSTQGSKIVLNEKRLVPILDEYGKTIKDECVYCRVAGSRNSTRAGCLCCDMAYCCEVSTGRRCHAMAHRSDVDFARFKTRVFELNTVRGRRRVPFTHYPTVAKKGG
mmetsp:Transcript_5236/g.14692  ORF Transcript_5236/g.14692 Transcript_5236/m.14692 type:complete len:222 (-) Transcript_5236:3152-3817(-)